MFEKLIRVGETYHSVTDIKQYNSLKSLYPGKIFKTIKVKF